MIPWRLHWQTSPSVSKWRLYSGGRCTVWPWTELTVPRMGRLTLSRTRPRRRPPWSSERGPK